jgi:hypothetical protein
VTVISAVGQKPPLALRGKIGQTVTPGQTCSLDGLLVGAGIADVVVRFAAISPTFPLGKLPVRSAALKDGGTKTLSVVGLARRSMSGNRRPPHFF